jgi:aryl-alcohol dehydrogenase-like predicted oxidoreductase
MRGVEQIVVGTVQLGISYGRRAGLPPPDEAAALAVLDEAWAIGVRAFDTAEAYGQAGLRLATWLLKKDRIAECSVSTKIDALSDPESACIRFAGAGGLTLLSHDAATPQAFELIRSFGSARGIEVGQSVYTGEEVAAAAVMGADRVQAPSHVFDSAPLTAAHATGVKFDARSVFLQGVLLEEPDVADARASGLGDAANAVASAAADAGLSRAAALLATIMERLAFGDRVVIGFDTPDQLVCIGEAIAAQPDEIALFQCRLNELCPHVDRRLLDPRTWTPAA